MTYTFYFFSFLAKMTAPNNQKLIRTDQTSAIARENSSTDPVITNETGYSSSDDDYLTDVNEKTLNHNITENYDSMSTKSGYSITTEANGDFEFYQNNNNSTSEADLESSISVPSNNEFFIINNVDNRPVMTTVKAVDLIRNSSQTDLNKNFKITRSNSKR